MLKKYIKPKIKSKKIVNFFMKNSNYLNFFHLLAEDAQCNRCADMNCDIS